MNDGAEDSGTLRQHFQKDDFIIEIEGETSPTAHARILSGAAEAEGLEDFSAAIHENPLGVFDASDFVLHEARREFFARQITEWHTQGWRTVIFFHNEAERERFAELQSKLPSSVETKLGLLYRGFTVPAAKLAVLTGAEIFGRHQQIRRVRGSKLDEAEVLRKARDVLSELREGDLVVHSEHGIGRFAGIETREGGKKEEVLVLHYADSAKLFVPLAHVHMVSRYVGVGGKAPSLSKLSENRWQKSRKTAEKSVEEFAVRMLSVAAVLMVGLSARRKELAVLRALGATPLALLGLVWLEALGVCLLGMLGGLVLHGLGLWALQDLLRTELGIAVQWGWPTAEVAWSLAGLVLAAWLAASVPALRAYRLSLVDGLHPPTV
jgi:transcription-repair coupling factor (superfamily II helicase)